VRTNSIAGATVNVRGNGTNGNALKNADVFLRVRGSQNAQPTTNYTTALQNTIQPLYTVQKAVTNFTDNPNPVRVDVKVENLRNYTVVNNSTDPMRTYSNTVTLSIVAN
jgi:hypothetical protein